MGFETKNFDEPIYKDILLWSYPYGIWNLTNPQSMFVALHYEAIPMGFETQHDIS